MGRSEGCVLPLLTPSAGHGFTTEPPARARGSGIAFSPGRKWLCETEGCVVTVQEDQGVYHGKVRDMINDNQNRLLVNINDLRRRNEKRASR